MFNYLKKILFSLLILVIPYMNFASNAMETVRLDLDLQERTILYKIRNVQDDVFLQGGEIGLVSDIDKKITESKKLWFLEETREKSQYLIKSFYNGDVLKVSENIFGTLSVTLGAEETDTPQNQRLKTWGIQKRTDGPHNFYIINDVRKNWCLQSNFNKVSLENANSANNQRWLFIPVYGFLPVK